jgi:hypothetical protein
MVLDATYKKQPNHMLDNATTMELPALNPMRVNEKLAWILEFAEHCPRLDTKFIRSLADYLEAKGRLTNFQLEAMNKIWDKWHVETWVKKELLYYRASLEAAYAQPDPNDAKWTVVE